MSQNALLCTPSVRVKITNVVYTFLYLIMTLDNLIQTLFNTWRYETNINLQLMTSLTFHLRTSMYIVFELSLS